MNCLKRLIIERKGLIKVLTVLYFGSCLVNPLVAQESKSFSYTNKNIPVEERVEDLLKRMTVAEKIAQMRISNHRVKLDNNDRLVMPQVLVQKLKNGYGGHKNPGDKLSPEKCALLCNQLQKYTIENSRLHIPILFVGEAYKGLDVEGGTIFERGIGQASSWNTELVKKVWDVIGKEARLRGYHMIHSPVADLTRDPRFGRMSESFGEDTHLVTEMIVNAIQGVQGDNKTLTTTHIGAVVKHFAGYGQVTGGRNFASVEMSQRTINDDVLPPFKAAVQRAKVLGIMPSHSDLNGVPCHANPDLLTKLLRNEWGFKGYVVSDAEDVARLGFFHKVAETPEEAVVLGLKAGVDIDLYSEIAYAKLPEILKTHPELETYIDRSVRNVLRTKFLLGLFDQPYIDIEKTKAETHSQSSILLSQKADIESIILLKNEQNILPLQTETFLKIGLFGPVMDENTKADFENAIIGKVQFIQENGYDLTDNVRENPKLTPPAECEAGIAKIVEMAKTTNLAILFLGGDGQTAREANFFNVIGDREDIELVSMQNELFERVKALGIPVIVVLKHKRTNAIVKIAEQANAILDTWDLGEQGNTAIAKILFGYENPSGKLTVTIPRSVGQLPAFYSQKEINYKKPYLFNSSEPLYPFGYGLSYTNFEYANLTLSDSIISKKSNLKVTVDVSNVGSRQGKEVVQLYIKDDYGSVIRPVKELKAFQKINLAAGEVKTVTFEVTPEMLSFTGIDMHKVVESGSFECMVGTSSQEYLTASFKVVD
ncbi:beta-glucosidase [Lutibacter sp. HS1-25]|uniref:glycoside hydrolase family 3 N-terminal domain-containing protein n=1 Tax=Lutibacter sp. HS1-25 TaxID=2485000 RepID=UPI0010113B98|nr:glycoside hydrolase family 3 N-terminal domain-containing protein [Lutibacter sp. HS1-25]RXP52967.1 beta-glucosidase [Lutibacter sp. HS1-25]